MTVDPSDGMTFWYTQEYFNATGDNWQSRIASFTFSNLLSVALTATPDTICLGDSSHLNALASGGSGTYTYTWASDPAGFSSHISNPVVAPIVSTMYIVTVNDSSSSVTDSILVTVHPKPTANAGPNASYPNTVPMFPITGTATNYSGVKWLTAGDGYFNIDTVLNTVYYPGANDRHDGGVLLTLLAYPQTPCSDTANDTVLITLTFPLGVQSTATVPFGINVSPNPCAGMFTLVVHGAGTTDMTITIRDIEGKTVFSTGDRSGTQDYSRIFDVSDLPKGIYTLNVKTDTQSMTGKLIIQ
jgi:hypothetical protein